MLYLIDILDDADYPFETVFRDFLATEGLTMDYQILSGLSPLPALAELSPVPSALLISGSPQSVLDQKPWMLALESLIRECHGQEIPIFGICFGHQILASALGGRVETLAAWEFGEYSVFLQAQHPYLAGLNARLQTLQVHQDHVVSLPPGAVCLGLSAQTPNQMFAIGKSFGVQFHPEYSVEMLQDLITKRHARLVAKGPFLSLEHLQSLASHWQASQDARQILLNFLHSIESEKG